MAETAAPGFCGNSKGQLKSKSRSSAAATGPAAALHGQVVWALVKGWPLWPAVVLTEEQMEDVLIPAARGGLKKGDCTKHNSQLLTSVAVPAVQISDVGLMHQRFT